MIDAIDRKLLNIIQRDARLTADQLGHACGLSPTAALKRVKKLRAEGIIERDIAWVSPKSLGYNVMAMVLVTLDRKDSNVIARFEKAANRTPEIIQCFYMAGDADFALTIVARSIEEIDAFTRRFLVDHHQIRNFKTCMIMKASKFGSGVPVPEADQV